MKIALVGATGYVGAKLLEEAVNRGRMIDELEDQKHTGHRFTVGY